MPSLHGLSIFLSQWSICLHCVPIGMDSNRRPCYDGHSTNGLTSSFLDQLTLVSLSITLTHVVGMLRAPSAPPPLPSEA